MNQWTTRQEARIPLLNGWLVSLTLHGLLLFSLLPLFRQSIAILPEELFHWEVALVQSASIAHNSVQTADTIKLDVPKQPERSSTVTHAKRTIQHELSPTRPIAPLKPQADAPAAPNSMPDSPLPVTSPSEMTTASIPNELPSTPGQTTELLQQQTELPMGSTTPPLETAVAVANEGITPTAEAAQPSPAQAMTSDVAAVSAIRPDYGWLQQAISRRLEELKRASRPSLDESRPLKVTVKAVVSREGILLDSAVVKSSGLDRIDQEALALVQRAFPMQFDRTLDRQQIVMRIPIAYSRE